MDCPTSRIERWGYVLLSMVKKTLGMIADEDNDWPRRNITAKEKRKWVEGERADPKPQDLQ